MVDMPSKKFKADNVLAAYIAAMLQSPEQIN